ncbi:Glycosyltransferase involved in cell wall bisynthesis [Microbacterium azadirachtae]|uniref:Glycosyltransferase involved in cell wall bisynthesis n=1 Tax=Microbacterium azadirachtae TaxID=582680 RepID=A0A1I6JHY3_9MICO|nr:glycosyltransferase [Microbacterium azadirachtae]SFR78531.1 Glycosyltransferase involved in cell wall bisynthesis [Microbacterium azadirachtae]
MRIVQIAPSVAPGAGISGVAWELERAFRAQGHTVESLTAAQLVRIPPRTQRAAWRRRLSMVGTQFRLAVGGSARARRYLAARPDAVALCHGMVLAGDVFVNHVITVAAVRARGHALWRILRNPMVPFAYVVDRIRYRGRTHRAVVALTSAEVSALERWYGAVAPPVQVIPNGVDLERFRPPTDAERRDARAALGLDDEHRVALFIGHELRWKGVPLAIDALVHAPTVMLLVVGGDSETIPLMLRRAERAGVLDRVHFAGVRTDLQAVFAAADMFVFPTLYEPYGMVVSEALASGLPVVATRQGCAADLIEDGVNGYLVDPDPVAIARRLEQIAATDVTGWRDACRRSVEHLGWDRIARRYIDLLSSVPPGRTAPGPDSAEEDAVRPLDIVHAVCSDGFAGVERFIVRLAGAQRAAGARVRVIGGDPARMSAALAGTGVGFVPARGSLGVRRALRDVRDDADVVNVHMTAAEAAAALAFGRGRRPAVVATRHFAQPRRRRAVVHMDAVAARVVDAEIAISRAVAAEIGVPSTVVRSGLPAPESSRTPPVRERILLVAQRLEAEKATDVAIEAFAASGLAADGWQLWIAGEGALHAGLEAQAAGLGVAGATRFLGYRSDVAALMAQAGILLAPCPREGLGLTVLEAMQAGLPVVAAAAGGHLDLLEAVDPDALFPPGDVATAAARLRVLAADPEARERLAEAAQRRQVAEFSLEAQVAGTAAVYRDAIARRAASRRGPDGGHRP